VFPGWARPRLAGRRGTGTVVVAGGPPVLVTSYRPDVNYPQLIAYVAPRAGQTLERADLESFVRDRLPVYMLPQHYELAMERLFAAGAVDVWLTPIVMKKGRPAITLSAIAARADEDAVARTMLTETTTIGVRLRIERRYVAPRASALLDTPYGGVRVKRAEVDGSWRVRAEYDDVVRIARERGLPLAEVAGVVERCAAAQGVPA